MTSTVITTLEEFTAVTASEKLTVVDYYAVWCGPCKMMAPYVDSLAADYPNVQFIKVDTDASPEIAELCQITAMPTFRFYKAGVLLSEFKGANKAKLLDTIKTLGTKGFGESVEF